MLGIIFLSYLLLEIMYQYILFQIFHKLSLFLFFADVYAMQERSHNISHLWQENPSHKVIWLKFRPSFSKCLRNLITIFIWEKVRLQKLRKPKYSILATILHIYQFLFLQSLIPTCTIYCVNLMILLYFALILEKNFKKCNFLQILILSFFFEQDLYEVWAKKLQRRYLSLHWTVMQNVNKPWPRGFKNGMINRMDFH